ncbi:MAG TPA: hypothetical protein VLK33_17630, partial [Terriglobales bacterium]|nr:hypothetical protein [Terriglobales bacterium]
MRQLTIERAAVIILFALLFALATLIPVDTDTWWHIRSGQQTLTSGMIYTDPFSFTKFGQPWINHSWGAQIILYGVWQLAGNFGLSIYVSALATAGMVLVYKMSTGSVYLRAFVLVIGAATAAVFWSPRPQMLSFFLSAVILYLLYLHKRRKIDRLWLIPIMMGIWGNLHAGFSIGFIFLFGSIAGEILGHIFNPKGEYVVHWAGVRKLVIVTLISIAALVINPYGLQMLAVPFQTLSIGALQNFIQEWNSPNFHERQTWPFVMLLLGLLGALGASKKRLDWTDFVLASGTAFMGLLAGRNIAVFAVVATPILTEHLDAILAERGWVLQPVRRVTPRMARMNAILVGVIVFAALLKVLVVLDSKTVQKAQEDYLPVKVTEHLATERPAGPMFNSYNWGGYLMYFLPDYPVFVDGRTDLYGDDFLSNDYLKTATGGPGWRDTLDKYGVNLVVVEAQSGLAG